MPNWCYNNLDITATTDEQKAVLERVSKAEAADGFISLFLPLPEALKDTVKGSGEEAQEVWVDGCNNWYDWQVANWGTKWDPEVMDCDYDGETLSVSFDSAWAPPVAFYEWLRENGYEVSANYYEPGMDFGGFWTDGDDVYMEDVSTQARLDESEWSEEFRELDSIYGIAEDIAQWDEDEDE